MRLEGLYMNEIRAERERRNARTNRLAAMAIAGLIAFLAWLCLCGSAHKTTCGTTPQACAAAMGQRSCRS